MRRQYLPGEFAPMFTEDAAASESCASTRWQRLPEKTRIIDRCSILDMCHDDLVYARDFEALTEREHHQIVTLIQGFETAEMQRLMQLPAWGEV